MEWRDALAQTFLAEVQSFGEDVLFRGETIPASVGQSEANKSLELSGYYEEQSLNLVIPLTEYSLLGSDPKVNETIIIRGQGFRIDSVEKREDAIELNVEKIAGFRYIDPTPPPPSANQQPQAPSNLVVAIDTSIPISPSNLLVDKSPKEPSQVTINKAPSSPSNIEAELPFVEMYLVMGQSNAHGHSPIADLTTEQSHNIHVGFHTSWHNTTSDATTTQYYSDYRSHMYIGETRGDDNETSLDSDKFGIEWGFAKQLHSDHTGHDKIGILKYAVGSSTIDDNASFSDWDPSKTTECFQGFKNALADAVPKIRNAGLNIRWKGFLWYQGESNGGNEPSIYQAHLEALISAIETELGVSDLPCVFCAPAQQEGKDMVVNEAFNNLARTRTDYDFIKISDYHDGTYYDVHLSAQNMYDAGIGAGEAMNRATSSQAPTSDQFSAEDLTTRLWLDMDDQSTLTLAGGYVTNIGDKSGNNYDLGRDSASATITPITAGLNGKNIISFDNDAEATSYTNINLQADSVHKWYLVMKATASDRHDGFLTFRTSSPTNEIILFNFKANTIFNAEWYINSGTALTGNATNLLNTWNLLALEIDVPNRQASAWLNGTAYNTNVLQGTNIQSLASGQLALNRYGTKGGSDWGEVIFAENITQAESDKIEGYLAHKWGLENNLPSSHDFRYYIP